MKNRNSEIKKIAKCKVIGIGSPLLDIVMEVSDQRLASLGFAKGSMNLVSELGAGKIAQKLEDVKKRVTPGGSAANTLAGINLLGNSVGFVGVIGKDDDGDQYQQKTLREGVFAHLSRHSSYATGKAFTFITPDGERTFATHLGAAAVLQKEHIPEDKIKEAEILHIEAYQLEDPRICQAVLHAVELAKNYGTKISLDLSDSGLIARNKALFREIAKEHIDVIFANEAEAKEFTAQEEEDALARLAELCECAVVKLGARGSLIKKNGKVHRIKPKNIKMVNTNGAGDMYAAGILHGLINKLPLKEAGALASHIASLVVASSGARIDKKHLGAVDSYCQIEKSCLVNNKK